MQFLHALQADICGQTLNYHERKRMKFPEMTTIPLDMG